MRKVILIFTFFLFLFSVFADDPEINTEKNKTGIEPSVTFPEYEENDSTRVPKSEFHKKSDMGVYNKEDYPDIFRPGGECCYTATVIPSIPYSDTGSTTGAANDYDEVCPYDCSIAPDVVYSYSPPDNVVIDIDLCNSSYDTKLYIYQNSCESANLVACNDDYWYGPPDDDCYMYSSYLPEVELFVGNEYFFIIDGYGPYHGNYELTIVQTGSTIPPGIDQWHQTNHCESRITFGDTGDVPTIAADFFGPGSDPFDGCVYLQGVPFPDDPLECTDTIIERLEEADLTDPPCTDVIDTEIVAMTLTSTAPIRVTGSGDFPAESFFDVFVEIDLPQLGDMSITKENEQGGTFTANLPVEPRFTFTPVDGGPPLEIVTEIIPLALTGEHPFSSVSQDPFIPGPGPLVLTAPGGSQLSIDPCPTRMDHFYGYMSGGYMEGGGTGYESTWFYYPEDDWWNIWFYDHPYDPDRTKSIFTSFTLNPLDPSPYAEVVFNWTTPAWSDLGLDRPPLPDDFTGGIPESTYIERSAPIFAGPLTELVPVEVYYDIPDYNPEWISIDISGTDFSIEYGYIWHICNSNYGENLREFGDAPEGELGYPSSGLPGQFPTCINEPTSGHIQHNNNTGAWFGSSFDFEPEGNAGACPTFNPDTYNEDECFGGLDPGLSIPPAYTIQGSIGSEVVNPCTITGSLGTICQTANWGPDIDILVHNTRPNEPPYQIAYVNVLADWNQDGIWANDPGTQCTGTPVPEHILVNFVIPPLYYALLSGLTPPGFQIGPNPDFVWVRFSITETPVGTDWHGDGVFEDGETEDYLLKIDDTEIDFGDAPAPYPTLETNNGARHNIAGPWLGDGTDSPDAEPDGQPNALALGDDFDVLYPPPNDDEDGVRFGSLIKGSSANVRITASGAGTLNAWLDFNADNDWADAGEQIFTNQALVAGQNSLTINVPASAAQ